ncbi:hypothetical protein [Candidatus Cyanaurora vandensis]|uniref:hypothetical protein n=1 Tax=Candidatus Cyanaurora vandensis TaxID=2714958 RepID=UPI00257D4818|nr:hypothetical protein [Candidatus Cyanaurora vandensis]
MRDDITPALQAIRERLSYSLRVAGCYVIGSQAPRREGMALPTRELQIAYQSSAFGAPRRDRPVIQDRMLRFELTLRVKGGSQIAHPLLTLTRDLLTGFSGGWEYPGYMEKEGFLGVDEQQYHIYAQLYVAPTRYYEEAPYLPLDTESGRIALEEGGFLSLEEGGYLIQ